MFLKYLTILALVCLVLSQGEDGGYLGSVVTVPSYQIFPKPPAADGGATIPPPALTALRPSTLVSGINTTTESTSCTTDKNQQGECVPYYLCNGNNGIVNFVNTSGIIDLHVSDSSCQFYLETCCPLSDIRSVDNPITPEPTPEQKQHQGCGWRNPNGVNMKTFGSFDAESNFGEFPWVVAILEIKPLTPQVYVGGGSLIDRRVVLTTANNVAAAKNLRIRVGEWDTQTTKEIHPYQERDVESVVIHEDFNKRNLAYNVALLFLNKPVDPAPHIGVACLPPPNEKALPDTKCFTTGWGKDSFGKEGRYTVILKKAELPLVDHRSCQDLLRKTKLGRLFKLHHTFMCAGGKEGKDTCKSDNGSPLVCPIELQAGRYVQNGIVAWAIGCGRDDTPGVFVDVSVVRYWIDKEVLGKGITDLQYSKY